jgi:sporulation protein YlmC with PRC-barrel domain
MSTTKSIRVFAELRDLEILDSDDELCGIADDIEFEGAPPRVKAILVGPGALAPRLPRWLRPLVRLVAGEGVVRVPWTAVDHVTSRITLTQGAEALGLADVDRRLGAPLKKLPAA